MDKEIIGSLHEILVLITYASSKWSDEPAQMGRSFTARTHKVDFRSAFRYLAPLDSWEYLIET